MYVFDKHIYMYIFKYIYIYIHIYRHIIFDITQICTYVFTLDKDCNWTAPTKVKCVYINTNINTYIYK